jgi:hypothetical protein
VYIWGVLLIVLFLLWAAALCACFVGEQTLWDFIRRTPSERREIEERMREHYPWVVLTVRVWRFALGGLILGVLLCVLAP